MPLISLKEKVAIGLFVDGRDIKFVRMERDKGGVKLKDFKTVPLVTKLDETTFAERDMQEIAFGSVDQTVFDLESEAPGPAPEEPTRAITNETVISNLLSGFGEDKYAVTYAITEPAVDYHILETDFGLKGKKLKERVLQELANIRSIAPDSDSLSILETGTGSLICIIREDGVHLANLVTEVKIAAGQRVPRIPVIDTVELAMMNAVRANYQIESDEHTLLIYVGQEFTRLIFMRGMEYQHFAPIIAEGIESVNLQNTVYSRASLEQDNIGIHHLDRIILAGDAQRLGLREFFKEKFAVSDVTYIKYDNLDTSDFSADTVDELSEYAVPIATAWKALEPKHPALYPSNVLPGQLASKQDVYKFAWHGYALIVLLFLVTLFLAFQIPLRQVQINTMQQDIAFKETQVLEIEQLQSSVNQLRNELNQLESALGLYEELVPGYNRWSRNLTHLSTGVGDLNSLWILDIQSTGDHGRGLEINGYSIYRARIPRFASLFDNAILQEVLVQDIRDRIVYRFKVLIQDTGVQPE
jgi:Tfp pilus assembly protein PilN